jgi:purine-binding chemotaxis protein CheW
MGRQAVVVEETGESVATVSQFLTFLLGAEQYGVEILKVQEIRGYSAVTPIPNSPAFIKGIINLRGTVVPVVDLRAKFSMPTVEYNKFTVIIVVTLGVRVIGLVVDAVSDVLDVSGAEMRVAPDFGTRVDTRFIRGVVTLGERMTVLLDIERLLSEDDVIAVNSLNEKENLR